MRRKPPRRRTEAAMVAMDVGYPKEETPKDPIDFCKWSKYDRGNYPIGVTMLKGFVKFHELLNSKTSDSPGHMVHLGEFSFSNAI